MRSAPALCRRALPLLLAGACARLPGAELAGELPAGRATLAGFAALSAMGLPLGSAVAVAPGRLLTNAHILPEGTEAVLARRGDGAGGAMARLLARSPALDLAVLAVPPGLFRPLPCRSAPLATGEAVWALGAPALGPALAQGRVARPAALLAGRGPGFTARIAALAGYSGGPLLDAAGRLGGLVTALVDPGPALLLAALTGLDLDGIARLRDPREVFVLSIAAAMAESGRIAPMG
ncbi:S1 family peptidase [Falsiroseomonas selenitidurans]|uniref:Trypsin-like peptidase domain-containing protein n=1 Tax=Falsiroseomonas selenitidurans TaxID=2716335 RepID=A0ABX1E9K0_9PROT|nr:serine protease [Falsiroseomonas selenitidurans]NKC32442.1 trypsin-like peptidase domain-containing protein [Falsiroseomonas selenitidurans]